MPLLPDRFASVLLPLVSHRIEVDARVVEWWWYRPPRGGNYRAMTAEISRFWPVDEMSSHLHHVLTNRDGYPATLQCRLPRVLEPDIPRESGTVRPGVPVHLTGRVQRLDGFYGYNPGVIVVSRPRVPGRPVDHRRPYSDPTPIDYGVDTEFRMDPDGEETYARGQRPPTRLSPEDLERLSREFDEQQANNRQEEESDT